MGLKDHACRQQLATLTPGRSACSHHWQLSFFDINCSAQMEAKKSGGGRSRQHDATQILHLLIGNKPPMEVMEEPDNCQFNGGVRMTVAPIHVDLPVLKVVRATIVLRELPE